MSPLFLPGDFLLIHHHPNLSYRLNDCVLLQHPSIGVMVKKIVAFQDPYYSLAGLHPNSISTLDIGLCLSSDFLGRVIFKVGDRSR